MNQLLGIRRLCWKESRQLLPLCAVILAIGFVVLLLMSWSPTGAERFYTMDTMYVFLILPYVFAVGAGALLVGQERENRTAEWLVNLPVSARAVMCGKFTIGLLGLAGMWIPGLFLFFASARLLGEKAGDFLDIPRSLVLLLFLHSLLTLLTFWAAAWRIKSTGLSLFAAALVTISPPSAIQVLTDFVWPAGLQLIHNTESALMPTLSPFGLVVMNLLLLGCLAVGWYGWRAGMRTLGPATVAKRWGRHHRDDVSAMGSSSIRHSISFPWVALIWQHTRQIQSFLTVLFVFVILIVVGMAVADHPDDTYPLSIPPYILAVSWLAVLSFQGDGIQHRIRFLADRGVSPRMVWRTRLVVPFVSSPTLPLLVIAVSGSWQALAQDHSATSIRGWVYLFGGVFILVFAISQWSGQLFSSPVIAAIASPLLSYLAICLAFTALLFIPTPVWLLTVATCIPFVATFVAMGRWMDGRLGRSYWAWHAGCLAVCLLLPTTPLLLALATEPTIPANAARVLMEHADRWAGVQGEPQNLVMPVPDSSIDDQRQFSFQELRRQLTTIAGPIGGYHVSQVTDYLQHEATETRRSLHLKEEPSPEAIQQAANPYRNALELLVNIVKRMRLSPQLRVQNDADQLEIWLLQELQAPETRNWIGDANYRAAVQLLSDATARNDARRRAVALSWSRQQVKLDQGAIKGDLGILFGGYLLRAGQTSEFNIMTWQQRVCLKRQASRVAWEFWQLLERKTAPTPEDLQRLTTFFADRPQHISADEWPPARQWFGEWERQGLNPAHSVDSPGQQP